MAKKKQVKKSQTKQDKQFVFMFILMISLIAIIILIPLIKIYFFDRFSYLDLKFYKTSLGDNIFYSTKIPVADRFGNIIGSFTISLQNDPRKLDKINSEFNIDVPTFRKDKTVYITTGKIERNCVEGIPAALILSGFLQQFAQMNVSGAISDKEIAEENNIQYITCLTHPKNTVINFVEGNVTEIKQIGNECYELTYADCDVLKVSEKFILDILKGYMKSFERI